MGFGNNSKKGNDQGGQSRFGSKKSGGEKEDKGFRKIGSVWENENKDGEKFFSFTADDYNGELIFRDKKSGKYYKVLSGNMMEPLQGAPDNLVFNLSVNVFKTDGKYPSVEELSDGDDSGDSSQD